MSTQPDKMLSKFDKYLFNQIDAASKQVRLLASQLNEIAAQSSISHSLIQDIANQMKNISTIEITELPDAITEGMKKIQKLNAHLFTDDALSKKLGESDFITRFTAKSQEFSEACMKLSEQAIKFEEDLDS